ncbi:MAG: hypothetical protein JF606_00320 [Burkholderiales bacterium]|nr:hypothetical protein [Burkholderiales bacterium]
MQAAPAQAAGTDASQLQELLAYQELLRSTPLAQYAPASTSGLEPLPPHAGGSAPALGGDDSSPGPSFFRGLTPYQNQFMPSPVAGSSPSLHGQEVASRWSGALMFAQPAQRVSDRSILASSVVRGLPTPGASFVLPEEAHASSTRPAATSPDLSSLCAEIPEDSFRVVAEGLSLTNHINNLADLEAYSNVSAASLNRLVSERTASDGSTRLQLTSVGEAYLNRFGTEQQRHTLSRVLSQ